MREMAVFEALACHPSSVARPSMPMSDERIPNLHHVHGSLLVKTGRKLSIKISNNSRSGCLSWQPTDRLSVNHPTTFLSPKLTHTSNTRGCDLGGGARLGSVGGRNRKSQCKWSFEEGEDSSSE